MNYDILGIGGPILDLILHVSDDFLGSVPGEKGGMEPIDFESLQKIIRESGGEPVCVPGGGARNTLHGLARFGEKCALLGMVGQDPLGLKYRSLLADQGIHPLLVESKTPTALVLSLVTPDGERTMRTFQGASTEIRGHHLNAAHFHEARLVHLEGYTLFNKDLTETAMRLAKEGGAKISFDLASFEIVRSFKGTILPLLEKYVDIVFANQEEVGALLGEKEEEKGCEALASLCEVSVVLMGQKGCWVKSGQEKKHCPAYPVRPLDTTGAGDLFASGFLHGYLRGYPLEICAHYGAIAGRAVVQVVGPVIPHEQWESIYLELKKGLG